MNNTLLRSLFAVILALFLNPFATYAQVDGEFRSAATGTWAIPASWEKYTAATTSWATATAAPSGATAIVTVRAGHTITLNTNHSFKKLTIAPGGGIISDGGGERRMDFAADTSILINNGILGGLGGSVAGNDGKIGIANAVTCKQATITGTGNTTVARVRFNASTSTVTISSSLIIDMDMTITSSGLTAWYNAVLSNVNEVSTITINAGKTVTMSGGLNLGSVTPTSWNGGKYVYNINGTLDNTLGGTTYMWPLLDVTSSVTVNVAGTWKIGKLDANYTGSNAGSVTMNILNGGLVDASSATTFNLGSKYFVTNGTGKLKRAIKMSAADTFAIGTSSTSYNPVIAIGTTQADTLSVGASATLSNPIGDPTKIVTRQWEITPMGTGAGVTATFGWQTAAQAAAFNQANPMSIFRYGTNSWTPVSGAAAITGSGTIASPFMTGAATAPATLSGRYVVGNTDAQVVVVPTVAITAAPGNTVCANTSVTFTATTTNISGAHYQWKVGGVNAGTDAPTFTTTTLANGNVVTCEVSYSAGGAAAATSNAITMTINPAPSAGIISGSASVCSGAATAEQLTSTVTGGTWSSSNPAVATVSATGLVTGVAVGSVTITYTTTNSCGTATATKIMAVTLGASAGTIAGTPTTICPSATTTFTSNAAGGVWSSNNTAVATVSATGVVTGVAGGTATIAYVVVNGCGRDSAKQIITVGALPVVAAIAGATTVCTGSSITLTNTTTGGVWSSNNANATISATGVVAGVTAGSSVISYKVTNTCGVTMVTYNLTIRTVPVAGTITGSSSVCEGSTITLIDTTAGGVWSNSNSSILTVSASGVVTGITAGTDVVSYTVSNTCGSAAATKTIGVGALPATTTVIGSDSVCLNKTITLTPGNSDGLWSSASGKTIITTDGIVTGVRVGLDTVYYSITNSCGTVRTMHLLEVWDCDPTGIRSMNIAPLNATVYPNPNNGAFYCSFASAKNESVTVVLTNMMGAVVASKTAKTNERINFEIKAASGIYFLNAATQSARGATKIHITQ